MSKDLGYLRFFLSLFFSIRPNEFFQIQAYLITDFDCWLCYLLHGRVVRPPALGAELRDVDEASVQGLPGVVKVVRQGNFLGVVARSEWGAIRAARALKATWSDWQGLPEQAKLWDHVRATKVASLIQLTTALACSQGLSLTLPAPPAWLPQTSLWRNRTNLRTGSMRRCGGSCPP
jgi:hypothetical protein